MIMRRNNGLWMTKLWTSSIGVVMLFILAIPVFSQDKQTGQDKKVETDAKGNPTSRIGQSGQNVPPCPDCKPTGDDEPILVSNPEAIPPAKDGPPKQTNMTRMAASIVPPRYPQDSNGAFIIK